MELPRAETRCKIRYLLLRPSHSLNSRYRYKANSWSQLTFCFEYEGHANIYLKSSSMASSSTINLAVLDAYKKNYSMKYWEYTVEAMLACGDSLDTVLLEIRNNTQQKYLLLETCLGLTRRHRLARGLPLRICIFVWRRWREEVRTLLHVLSNESENMVIKHLSIYYFFLAGIFFAGIFFAGFQFLYFPSLLGNSSRTRHTEIAM